MFRQLGIYSPMGQLYTPVDRDQLAWYREERNGQILEEGISEAGSLASWMAAGTAYANHGIAMIPFFIFYSMFGFQRVGDLIWQAGDMRTRGFLLGATSGRTTLNGEGLQHQDGHSQLVATTVPNCVAYDPTYAYELAVILRDGLSRMLGGEDVFYYVTLLNENYAHPPIPTGVEEGIRRGMYLLSEVAVPGKGKKAAPTVQLLGSGAILREVEAAARLLAEDFGVGSTVWSVPSFSELRREGLAVERWNRRHPREEARRPYVARCLGERPGPVVAATDYLRTVADQIRAWVAGRYLVLGTDGFGRSDRRERLRSFFEVDRHNIVVAALEALAADGALPLERWAEALERYALDPEKPAPWTV
jgi:pyruvate dehydrogenase E1 component